MRLALAAVLALAACTKPSPVGRLGVAGPLTGDLSADGTAIERAVRLAVELEAAETGLPAPEVVSLDDRADPFEAEAVARRLADDPEVFAVIGHMNSGCAIAASRVYSGAGLAMITPSATAPELTLQQGRPDWGGARVVFRLPPSDAVQGEVAAEYATKRFELKRAIVFHDRTPYGLGLAESFRGAFARRGGEVAAFEAVTRGDKDFPAALEAIARARPDALFFGGVYVEGGLLLKQARAAGYRGVFLAGDGVKSQDFFALAGPASEGAYLTVGGVPVESLPSAADFLAAYQKKWNEAPRTFDHFAYEAARIALKAMRKDGPARAKVLKAVADGEHRTMLGNVVFDAKGDAVRGLVTFVKADFAKRRFEPYY